MAAVMMASKLVMMACSARSEELCPGFTVLDVGVANAAIALANLTASAAASCCAACGRLPRCAAWTWHPPNSSFEPKRCWLMPVPAARHGIPGSVVSGIPPPPPPPPPLPPLPPPDRPPALGFRPHIVFILTDDQDLTQQSTLAMPQTRRAFGLDRATGGCAGGGRCYNITRAYVATPICCPSRSSYLSGRYTHNHHTIQNSETKGCAAERWVSTMEPDAYPAYLSRAGYRAAFFGKYLNQYGNTDAAPLSHIPPGWTHWVGLRGNSAYYNYELSVNGVTERHADEYTDDYLPDLLSNRSTVWLANELAKGSSEPILTVVHTPSPHRPAVPAPKYANSFSELMAPRTPSWNHVGRDKHQWLSDLSPMDANVTAYSDHIWRRRLRSLQSIDDMVASLFATVVAADSMDRTVFIYTSDHGYHSGQWAVPYCKMLPYEEDVRIPMFIRLPPEKGGGASNGLTIEVPSPILNIDLAPTLLDFAGYTAPKMDGASILPLLEAAHSDSAVIGRSFLVEYWPIPDSGVDVQVSTLGTDGWCTDQDVVRKNCPKLSVSVDSVNNTWACMRTILSQSVDTLYCLFWDGTHWDPATSRRDVLRSNFIEFYDLVNDPFQLSNAAESLSAAQRTAYNNRLTALMSCGGGNCQSVSTAPLLVG